MFELSGVELVGYLASLLVVVSLAMTSVVRLRIISLVGSVTFVVYGSLIGSVPIIVTNGAIALINIWYLRAEFAKSSPRGIDLGASPIRPDSPFLHDFVTYHLHDIHRFQPDFTMPTGEGVVSLLLSRDGLPAGLVVGRRRDDEMTIDLDYVLAPYRDSRIGRWLFGPGAGVFRDLGIEQLRSAGDTDTHRRYLHRMGFTPLPDDPGTYQLTL